MNSQFIQGVMFDWNKISIMGLIRKAEQRITQEEYADIAHPSAKYHEKSHGESFLVLTQNNLQANGLYLFDEPEAALSPQRQLTLLMEIYRCAKEGSQFLIVTHSPILPGIPNKDMLRNLKLMWW